MILLPFKRPRNVAFSIVLAAIVAGCQHVPTAGPSPQPVLGSADQPETQSLPPVDGPRYPESEPVTAPSDPASDWQAALAPYLENQGGVAASQQQVAPTPPVLRYDGDAIRVGLLLPTTGRYAAIGKAMHDAALLALFDFGDERFELLPHDTRGQPGEAAYAAGLAIGDGAQLLVGPLLGTSVEATAATARAAGVPVIGLSSDRTVSGDGVYVMGFLPGAEVNRVATYALNRGLGRFAVLAPDDAYGATVAGALYDTVTRFGGRIVESAFYNPAATNLEPVIRELADYDERRKALLDLREELADKEDELSVKTLKRLQTLETMGDLPYDTLLIADGGARLQQVAALLPFYDIDPRKVRMIGTGQWDAAGIGAEPALLGGWFAAPDPAKRQNFLQRFEARFGYQPPRLATLAYDAMALASVLARNGAISPYTPEALTLASGYAGRDGIFRLTPEGVTERGLAVLQVQRRGARVIDPAPTSFNQLTN